MPAAEHVLTLHRSLDARQSAVHARILATARDLIGQHGHESISMESIAAAADVSRATLYRYFSNRDHVVSEAALDWGQDLAPRLATAVSSASSPAEVLGIAIDVIVTEATSNLPMVRATMMAVMAQGPAADDFRASVRQLLDSLFPNASGSFESGPPSPVTILGRILFANLSLLSVGDITAEMCKAELKLVADRVVLQADHDSDQRSRPGYGS